MRSPFTPDLEARLRTHVDALAGAPRAPGAIEHTKARRYVNDALQAAGFSTFTAFLYDQPDQCWSLYSRPLPGTADLPLVIVGAHYDSGAYTPGADDNASGLAALIELARWIRPQLDGAEKWATARLQLAAYDLEEYGMVGSIDHAQNIDGPLRCMISLEMLGYTDKRPGSQQLPPRLRGYYPDVGDFIGVCGNDDSARWVDVVTKAMKSVPGLPVESLTVPGRGESLPPVRLSDHSSFWDRGLPALMITDTSFFRNPHYHQPSDTPDTLDYPFLALVTRGVGAAVMRLLAAE